MRLWCHHRNQTSPRRDERGEYRRCLDCGARLAWSWSDRFPIRPPKIVQSGGEVFSWADAGCGLERRGGIGMTRRTVRNGIPSCHDSLVSASLSIVLRVGRCRQPQE
jgi:hypothetical protein